MITRVIGFSTVLLISVVSHIVRAQGLVAKTNELSIDFKNSALPDSGPLPKINWIVPQLEFTNSVKNRIEVNVKVEALSPIKDISLVIGNKTDGSVIATKRFEIKSGQSVHDISSAVSLPDGTSYISLDVTTSNGAVISERRQILVGKDAAEDIIALDRKDYALLFATNKYDNWDDLVNPIDDAHTIAQELREKYGFNVEIVENPTVEIVWEKIRDYNERKFSPQDQLLVFFAGHGHYDESFGEGYVVAKNSLNNDLSKTTYLSHNRLRGVINNIQCNHILLMMDVCFGGTLDPVLASSRGARENEVSTNQMLVRKWNHRTRKYLTSGGKEYVSDGIAGKHSPFAGKIIESLKGRGGDDGVLTFTELLGNLEKLKQLPRTGSFGNDEPLSDFVFVGKR